MDPTTTMAMVTEIFGAFPNGSRTNSVAARHARNMSLDQSLGTPTLNSISARSLRETNRMRALVTAAVTCVCESTDEGSERMRIGIHIPCSMPVLNCKTSMRATGWDWRKNVQSGPMNTEQSGSHAARLFGTTPGIVGRRSGSAATANFESRFSPASDDHFKRLRNLQQMSASYHSTLARTPEAVGQVHRRIRRRWHPWLGAWLSRR